MRFHGAKECQTRKCQTGSFFFQAKFQTSDFRFQVTACSGGITEKGHDFFLYTIMKANTYPNYLDNDRLRGISRARGRAGH
jgi:hypothetical protein